MKTLGWILLFIGIIAVFIAFNMEVSVVTSYGDRVNNVGLMAQRQNFVLISCFIMLCGLLIVIFVGRKKQMDRCLNSIYVKCPYCAEDIHPEAIKCKHCSSDLHVISKNNDSMDNIAPASLIIKLKHGYMIDENGVRKFIANLSCKYPNADDLQSIASDEIYSMMNSIPSEVHESYKRKVKQIIMELSK